ncbi:unnamed protein product [marine sediment metagenome]|uniref:Uncharacterized protein n=1 Tax=marine sediment metagenome TaxID=412755 RepID=X1FFI7_9ZZZZ
MNEGSGFSESTYHVTPFAFQRFATHTAAFDDERKEGSRGGEVAISDLDVLVDLLGGYAAGECRWESIGVAARVANGTEGAAYQSARQWIVSIAKRIHECVVVGNWGVLQQPRLQFVEFPVCCGFGAGHASAEYRARSVAVEVFDQRVNSISGCRGRDGDDKDVLASNWT